MFDPKFFMHIIIDFFKGMPVNWSVFPQISLLWSDISLYPAMLNPAEGMNYLLTKSPWSPRFVVITQSFLLCRTFQLLSKFFPVKAGVDYIADILDAHRESFLVFYSNQWKDIIVTIWPPANRWQQNILRCTLAFNF